MRAMVEMPPLSRREADAVRRALQAMIVDRRGSPAPNEPGYGPWRAAFSALRKLDEADPKAHIRTAGQA